MTCVRALYNLSNQKLFHNETPILDAYQYTSVKCPLLLQISKKQHDLKKKLKVTFAGEPGLDMGGLTKEWFLLLIKKIFHENYGNY